MKTATVFGSLSNETSPDFNSIFDILKQHNIQKVFIGGYYGQLKEFTAKCKENNIEVNLIITKKGKDLGYGSDGSIEEIAVEKYFDKKSFLYSSSDLFIFLPTEKIGLGLLSEVVDLLEYSVIYCKIVKIESPRIIFMGPAYKIVVDNVLTQTSNTPASNIEYAY